MGFLHAPSLSLPSLLLSCVRPPYFGIGALAGPVLIATSQAFEQQEVQDAKQRLRASFARQR